MFGLTPDNILGRLVVILLGIPIHEWAHGWVAHLLGDETPELQGRLTLNPLTHLDPIGTLMILLTGFGWGRAARVNPYRMTKVKSPRVGMALSALAGPLHGDRSGARGRDPRPGGRRDRRRGLAVRRRDRGRAAGQLGGPMAARDRRPGAGLRPREGAAVAGGRGSRPRRLDGARRARGDRADPPA